MTVYVLFSISLFINLILLVSIKNLKKEIENCKGNLIEFYSDCSLQIVKLAEDATKNDMAILSMLEGHDVAVSSKNIKKLGDILPE